MGNYEQPSLFDRHTNALLRSSRLRDAGSDYGMGKAALVAWKQAIAAYQQQIGQERQQPQASLAQGTLFDLGADHCNPDAIDPFALPVYPFNFYDRPFDGAGEACIYFAIDRAVPLLLYVGETIASDRRWKGVHDCKRYVANYTNLHATHGLERAICTAFWWEAPRATRARKRLESHLIARWKPPFNKENWSFWQTPFVGGKA